MTNSLQNDAGISSESLIIDLLLLDEDFSSCCLQNEEYLKLLHQQQIEMNGLKMKHREQKKDLRKDNLEGKYSASDFAFNS
jgi:hypothetical protein